MCIFVVVSAKHRSSVLQRTRCSSKCTLFVPRRITSPITICRALGRAAKRHAIRCRSAATTDPSQCAEQRSFIPASSTTTVGRQNGHCVNHINYIGSINTHSHTCISARRFAVNVTFFAALRIRKYGTWRLFAEL